MRIERWTLVLLTAAACNDGTGESEAFGDGGTSTSSGTTTTGMMSIDETTRGSGTADGTGTTGSTGATDSTGEPIFDVGTTEDLCGCDKNYIWVANSSESTVSKINTETLVEEARYLTRADALGNPSRTSVSFTGDVAVANRHGGLTKFYADPEDCVDRNGMPGIQTSTGALDVLSWEMEECRAWSTELPTTNQRPVAWAPPDDPENVDCDRPASQRLWTVGSTNPGIVPGTGGAGGATAWLVNGDDGSILETVDVAMFNGSQLGAYGGAVNRAGDLFFCSQGALTFGINSLVRVTIDTFEVTIWPVPPEIAPYGITVDHNGRVWMSSMIGQSAVRFDPEAEVWDIVDGSFLSQAGLQEHPSGQMWIGTNVGAIEVDVETLALGNVFVPDGGGDVKGISVDADGYVWAINQYAHKFDPASGAVVGTYTGLSSPYTYSDMTGWALENAACTPEG
jgi:DNA-binding beta-propeller fold protein YncE